MKLIEAAEIKNEIDQKSFEKQENDIFVKILRVLEQIRDK